MLKRAGRSTQETWRSLGRITPLPDAGWFALDLHSDTGRPRSADSFDQLCLADREGPDRGISVPIESVQVVDDILKIQVAGPLSVGCDLVWTIRLTPQHLWKKLREGIAALDKAELADRLAAGRLDPLRPRRDDEYPPGLLPAQRLAYRACVEPGLHAVWGPPGTGKTSVLARAIEDLVRNGKRVLLVSTANVAVDNALKGVLDKLQPAPGVVIRVGPPHLPELAANDDVQLRRLAARATTEIDAEVAGVQEELAQLDKIDAMVDELGRVLGGYDHYSYSAAELRVETSRLLGEQQVQLLAARNGYDAADKAFSAARAKLQFADAERHRVESQRVELERARELSDQLAALERELDALHAELVDDQFSEKTVRGLIARHRAKRALAASTARFERHRLHVGERRLTLDPLIERCLAAAGPITMDYVSELDRALAAERQRFTAVEAEFAATARRVREIETRCTHLERKGVALEGDYDLITSARRRNLPNKHHQWQELLVLQADKRRGRGALEERLRLLNKKVIALRRDAEGEIVAGARVVATTLARSRAHTAVARQQFDVVLVDEAGAATLAEVLLAVSQATSTAVLLGDFLQLGPVLADVDKLTNPNVAKWVAPNGFTHCGVNRVEDVADNEGCVALLHQFRFGTNLRELANDVVYRVLEDGVTLVSGRPPEDTEIVVVDVSGLEELGVVHRSGKYAGWWAVGALLARALVEHHAADPGGIGVVTTFKQQVDATHAVLRDSGRNLSAAVGTAHSFQGREFDTVIFDLVEDGRGWIKNAKWDGGTEFERDGVRLFGVGITRARHRLYLVVDSRAAIKGALGGTPLGAVGRLGRAKRVQWCRAAVLLGMADDAVYQPVSAVEDELHEVLRGLVDVTDVHDEFTFDDALERHLTTVRRSLWMWSPWVGKKSKRFLPLIEAAVARGVDVRVFIRTERDQNMRKDSGRKWVAELVATGAKVVRAEVEHRKVVVLDRTVALLGSHNPLSQYKSREMMIACRGAAFAERLLIELQAETYGNPPNCDRCGRDFELWRSAAKARNRPYFWRCHPCKVDRAVAGAR
ncbi:MAG: AAA domain-containing protein [Umezawaea sp.]